jgi:hypothetical protein
MDNTLEYIFFHQPVCEKLCAHLDELGIPYKVTEQDDVITVSHADDLDDALLADIESIYDMLFDEESRLTNTPDELDEDLERDVVGVGAELADGRLIQVRLAPGIARRVLSVLSTEELREMVNEIALQVEQPIDGPLCKGETKRG